MKKLLLSMLLLATSFAALQAQTEKGDWMVGGNFRLNTSGNTEISLTPNAGIFLIRNLAFGGNVNLNYSKDGNVKTTALGIGPYVRYYFGHDQVRPILHGNFNFLSSKVKFNGNSTTNNGTNFFLGGGAAIFISEHVSLDILGGYDHTDYNSLNGTGGFALNVGFQVYLHKNQVDGMRRKKKAE
jgi:outer membrane protein